MMDERFSDPVERYLTILGRVSETTLANVALAEPEVFPGASRHHPEKCRALFIGHAYAPIPVGRKYDMLFPLRTPSTGREVYTEIVAVASSSGKVLISIPEGLISIALIYFQSGNASVVDEIPFVDHWADFDNPLCICDRKTWNLRCDKQFGRL